MKGALDTTRLIELPEGVELELRLAGPVVRALALSIDTAIRAVLEFLYLFLLVFFLEELGMGIFLILLFLTEWFYPVFFELYAQGATPGKKLMKIKVVQDLGLPINWSSSLIRNLLRVIDFLPFFYGFGLLTMLVQKDFKRIGDLAAGTVVIYRDEINAYLTLPQGGADPWILNLSLAEQRTIVNFAQRSQTLTRERAIELANLVTPLTGKTGEEGVRALCQIARGFIGEDSSKGPH